MAIKNWNGSCIVDKEKTRYVVGSREANTLLNLAFDEGNHLRKSHKTKKQVMQEIISKSKHYKAQKAMDKEEDNNLMEKLAKDCATLAQSESLRSLTQPSKMIALKALLNKNSTKQSTKGGGEMKEVTSGSADKESLKSHKTKKQVMQEIISKSKHYKAQKAMDKEEDDNLMDKLDKDFATLSQSEALRSLTQPSRIIALKALLNKNSTKQSTKGGGEMKEVTSGSADKESLKAQKAMDKEEDDNLVEKLDKDFATLAQSEALRS